MENIKVGQRVRVIGYKNEVSLVYVADTRDFDRTSPMFESPIFVATNENGDFVFARKEGMELVDEE